MSQARQTRYTADAQKRMSFIEWRSTLYTTPSFRNRVSGIIAGNKVNYHCAKEIGDAIIRRKGILLEATKSHLANDVWCAVPSQAQPSHSFKYVLDGGALLHRITWHIGDTYEKISQDYSNYVTKKYGQAVVVFDGYHAGPSMKDCTHRRRVGCQGRKVIFNTSMKLQMKKKEFLSNRENKQSLLALLGDKLCVSGCEVQHATRDADLLIVQTAVTLAGDCGTVLSCGRVHT